MFRWFPKCECRPGPQPKRSICVFQLGRTTGVMNMQELARGLGHPDAQKLLSGSMARLAYNGHDGFPRVIPVGFYWTGVESAH